MLNQLILMGRLTADPELKTTSSGTSVATFTLAVERNYAQNGEKKTDFVNCVAWRGTAEFISTYFSKGRMMSVVSELQSRSYENAEGRKITVWEALVKEAYFCGDRQDNQVKQNTAPKTDYEEIGEEDEDLPF